MSTHVQSEYVPPKSWEQFEELCADLFQEAWQDPALVRHGRAGQRQHGVDIIARHGAQYPVGLQCKRRARWPVKKLTAAEIDKEVAAARKFYPPLESFYLLTTAVDDAPLQAHVRAINKRHAAKGLFNVVLLGWSEIVRRATLREAVADKHFGGSGGAPRSPLLATWFSSKGKLELKDREFKIAVTELAQDLHDWPSGRIVFRQRETDALLETIHAYVGRTLTLDERAERVKLRERLRQMKNLETRIIHGLKLMLADKLISSYLLLVWEPDGDLPIAVSGFIDDELDPKFGIRKKDELELRLTPPGSPKTRLMTYIPPAACSEIVSLQMERKQRYGQPLTDTVGELPAHVRARHAIPAIIRNILRQLDEGKTLEDLRRAELLHLGSWKIQLG